MGNNRDKRLEALRGLVRRVVTLVALIDFKHVGTKSFEKEHVLARTQRVVPVGIKTPLEVVDGTFLAVNMDPLTQVADNLRNLLLTNHGDRVVLYDFGANLLPLVVEWTSKEDFDQEAMIRINTAITKWMPYVTPLGFDSAPGNRSGSPIPHVKILLVWAVPAIKADPQRLEFTLAVA